MREKKNLKCLPDSELDEERGKGEHTHFSLLHAFFSVKMATTILTKINAGRHGENMMCWERDAQENQASF